MGNVAWSEGLRAGAGYDCVRGEAKQEAVIGELAPMPDAAGQSGEMTYIQTQTSDEVDTALEIDAEVKVGVGPFGGSAKMSFREKCKVSNEATFCVLSVNAYNAYQQLVRPRLSDEAKALLATGKTERFRERFGDNFVSGQWIGVEFYGVVRIEASTREKQVEIASKVSASYGLAASGSASVGFGESMSSSSHKIEVYTFQKGGTVNVCRSIEELIGNARAVLEGSRAGQGYPFEVTLDPYTELELPNDNASLIQTEAAERAVRAYAKHIRDLTKMANDIDFVRRNPAWFENADMKRLNDAAKLIASEINTLSDRADICSRYFDQCELYSPSYPEDVLPKRKTGAAGGQSVGRWVGVVRKDQMARQVSPALARMLHSRTTMRAVALKRP